ncbi:PepSY domain-containing protein [Oceanobacillus sojae]|uniref:PepSY domain-containing protein n=1 Tax=Oceanobacillus sojae TaxID=582851 RepID=UPI0036D31792
MGRGNNRSATLNQRDYLLSNRRWRIYISVFPPKAKDEATMHIDQYSGEILADYLYDNYEPLGKLMSWGITVHKGLEYGLANQFIGLFVCLGIMRLIIEGLILWWERKPEGHFVHQN